MMLQMNLITLFIWSGLVLKIFLVVSVVVLALYIFVLEGRYLFFKSKHNKLIKKLMTDECKKLDKVIEFEYNFEAKRLRLLKILWSAITILSIILFFTYE